MKMDLPSNPLAKIVRKSCEVLNPDDFCAPKQIKTASGFEGSAFQSMPMLAGNPKCRTLMLLCAAGDPKSRTLMLVCAAGDLKSRTLVSKSCRWRSKVLYPSAVLTLGAPCWRSRAGVPVLAFPCWRSCAGVPVLAFPCWRSHAGVPGGQK